MSVKTKIASMAVALSIAALCLAGCSEADMVSANLSLEADKGIPYKGGYIYIQEIIGE